MHTETTLPTTLADRAANLLKASEGTARILKFKKGKYLAGETEVPVGREFLAYCGDWTQGFVKFVNGEVVDRKLGKVADGFHAPEREDLDETDETKWPIGLDGKPADPWTFQHYLPLEDLESGERFLFVTGSAGGAMAVRSLCNKYARNIAKGLPSVSLAVAEFKSKKYGATARPDFPIAGWENADTDTIDVTPPAPSVPFNDNIPF